MSVLGIRLYGDPVLTRKTRPAMLPSEREVLADLVRNLFDTMEAFGGVGLAANQAGIGLRVAVIRIPPKEGPGRRCW